MTVTKNTSMTIFAIVASIITATVLAAVSNSMMVSASDSRFVSERTDTGQTGRECLSKDAPNSQEIMKEQKQICREVVDKCSSSQTGFGTLPKP